MPSTAEYTTPEEVREQIDKRLTTKDGPLTLMIRAASRAIDNACNRPDGFLAPTLGTARLFTGSGDGIQRIDECAAVSLVEARDSGSGSYVAWEAADWVAASGDPRAPDFNSTPYTFLLATGDGASTFTPRVPGWGWRGWSADRDGGGLSGGSGRRGALPSVRVTARWGYALTVPDPIRQATITQVARWFKRGESAWADAVGSEQTGGVLMYRKPLDPDIVLLLRQGRYIRVSV